MISIIHPILFQRPSSSEVTEKSHDYNRDYIAFPEGQYKSLKDVKLCEPAKYIQMKDQFLVDIDRLKSLTQRLIHNVYDKEINIFHQKIINDLRGEDEKPSSLISFQDTRYYLHNIVNRTERFIELEAQNPDEADKFAFNRDGFCALFYEFLSGIDHCLDGSSSRIQSAFTSLENSRDPLRELLKIRHGLLEYGVKSFLAKERANGQIEYFLGNEVHTHNKLYNTACERFGLDPLNETRETLGSNAPIIYRFNRILPSLMPEFEILNKLTEVFYQDLVFTLKKRNKEDWLTHPVSNSELTDEITDGIKEDFITPINLRFKTNSTNKLDLWTIIKPCDDGSYEFSESRERFQVWLIDNFLNHTPGANVFSIVGKNNNVASFWDFLKKDKDADEAPLFYIGSKDNLYFWAFESETLLVQGANCNLDWDNHQTLTLGHLKTVDFYSFPKETRFNIFYHALNNSNKPDDFFEFFFNQTASKEWDKVVKSDPRIKEIMLEKLVQTMNDGEAFIRELTDRLKNLSASSDKVCASHFFNDLICQAFKLKQIDVIDCLFEHGLCKNLTKVSKAEYQRALFSTLRSNPEKFKILCKYTLIDFNSKNEKGETLLTAAAENGQLEGLKELLAQKEINVNKRDNISNTPLMLAALNGQTECLKELLAQEIIKLNVQNNDGWTALKIAARYGKTECLQALLKKPGIKANLGDKNGWTPLMAAARNGHGDCVQELLEHDHDVSSINARDYRGYTTLMLAAIGGDERCASLLLQQKGINIHKTNYSGKTALMLAAENGQTKFLKVLLKQKEINVNTQDHYGNGKTALMLAAQNGQTECLEELLKQKEINVNTQNNYDNGNGQTALMLAAQNGQTECLEELLELKSIKPNMQNNNGWTALEFAVNYGQTKCLQALLKKPGIKANLRNKNGWTPLMTAASKGHGDCVQALLEHDVSSINAKENRGHTALILAVDGGDERCASLLLQQPDIDINAKNFFGQTAWLCAKSDNKEGRHPWKLFQQIQDAAGSGDLVLLTEVLNSARALIHIRDGEGLTLAMLAAKNGHVDCLQAILAQEGIELNAQDNNGWTALMHAARNGQTECLKVLIEQKEINANLSDKNGWTPLMSAARYGHGDCVQALLDHGVSSINAKNKDDYTALMLAACRGSAHCIRLLLSHPEVNINREAVELASDNEHWECFQLLVEKMPEFSRVT